MLLETHRATSFDALVNAEFERRILEALPLCIVVLDALSWRVLWRNAEAASALGYAAGPNDADPSNVIHPEDRALADQVFLELTSATARNFVGADYRIHHADGSWRWFHLRWAVLARNAHGEPVQFVGAGADISEYKERELEVEREASRDSLTGVLNRRRFLLELETRISNDARPMSLCVCDLDRFKSINDTYGHGAGDVALQGFAGLLTGLTRQNDVVARIGGDEFCLLLPAQGSAQAAAVMERVRSGLHETQFVLNGDQFAATASFGIAEYRLGMSVLDWLARADEALYQAKREGRDRVFFHPLA